MQPNGQGQNYQQLMSYLMNALNGNNPAMQQRQNFLQAVNQDIDKQVGGAIKNGSNGVAVNPNPLVSGENQSFAGDTALTSQMLVGLLNAANTSQGNQIQQQKNNQDYALGAGNLRMQERLNGIDPSTGNFAGSGTGGNNNTPDVNGQLGTLQDVNNYSAQGAKALLDNVPTTLGKMQLAGKINAAGGLANYRKSNAPTDFSPADLQSLTGQASVINHVQDLLDGIQNDKKFAQALGDPYSNFILEHLGPSIGGSLLGMTGKQMDLYNKLNQLNANADYQNIHGRLDNFLAQKFGNSSVGKDQNAATNTAILKSILNDTKNNLGSVAKSKGYANADDLVNSLSPQPATSSNNGTMKIGKYTVSVK